MNPAAVDIAGCKHVAGNLPRPLRTTAQRKEGRIPNKPVDKRYAGLKKGMARTSPSTYSKYGVFLADRRRLIELMGVPFTRFTAKKLEKTGKKK